MQVLRTCIFGYGFSGALGLVLAMWGNIVAGLLVAWLGGAVLSIFWSFWSYRRHRLTLIDPSDISPVSFSDHLASDG